MADEIGKEAPSKARQATRKVHVVKGDSDLESLISQSLAAAGVNDPSSGSTTVIVFSDVPDENEGNGAEPTLTCGRVALDLHTRRCDVDGVEVLLTPREDNVLEQLLRSYPEPISRSDLVDQVWGEDFTGDRNVADVYLSYLRKKLGRGRIETLRNVGYRLVP